MKGGLLHCSPLFNSLDDYNVKKWEEDLNVAYGCIIIQKRIQYVFIIKMGEINRFTFVDLNWPEYHVYTCISSP